MMNKINKREYDRKYYAEHKEERDAKQREYEKQRYSENKNSDAYKDVKYRKRQLYKQALIQRWKQSKGCTHCGISDYRVLELDHINPDTKSRKGKQAICLGWGKPRLKEELAKCQVLCANCHRIKTIECNDRK